MIEQDPELEAILRAALKEDIGAKDLTAQLVPPGASAKADITFNEPGVLCGIQIVEKIFRMIDENLRFLPAAKDGDAIEPERVICYIEGPCRSILSAERVALNFLGYLSGIATLTNAFVKHAEGTRARILDTRKTTPTLRKLERYAVRTGGGQNHRFGLFDGVLIKDNHLASLKGFKFPEILKRARAVATRNASIGLEVTSIGQLKEALNCGFDYILLDNFPLERVKEAVELRKKVISSVEFEVSGGVKLDNVRDYARTGVERISIGALTHSARSIDVSLNLI